MSMAFVICGGPSLDDCDLARIPAGVLTLDVNGHGYRRQQFRPDQSVCLDPPGILPDTLLHSPGVLTWLRRQSHRDYGFVPNARWLDVQSWRKPEDIDLYLSDPHSAWWGTGPNRYQVDRAQMVGNFRLGPSRLRSNRVWPTTKITTIAVFSILYHQGVREVYMLGADMKGPPYDRAVPLIRHLHDRVLRPAGMRIFNCSPDSALDMFEHVPYEEAHERAVARVQRLAGQ